MNIRNVAILALAAMLPFVVQAQKKKRSGGQPVVAPAENPRITAMRQLTQQVVFIDSAVISKDEFLKIVRLSPETVLSYPTTSFSVRRGIPTVSSSLTRWPTSATFPILMTVAGFNFTPLTNSATNGLHPQCSKALTTASVKPTTRS